MIEILNIHILIALLLSTSKENQPKMHSALPEISKSLQCSCSLSWKKVDFLKQKPYFFAPIFQLIKYLCFLNLTTFCLVFGLVTFLMPKFSQNFFSRLEKIRLFPRSHPIPIGKTTFSCKTGPMIVTQFTTVSDVICLLWAVRKGPGISELKLKELLPAMSAPLCMHMYFYICV